MSSREALFEYIAQAGLFFLFVNILYAAAHHINPLPEYSNHPEILEEYLPFLWRVELIFYALPCIVAVVLDGSIGGLFLITFFEYIVFLPLIFEFFRPYAISQAAIMLGANTFFLLIFKLITRKTKISRTVHRDVGFLQTIKTRGFKPYKIPLELEEFYETVRNKYIKYFPKEKALRTLILHDTGHRINVEEEEEYFEKYGRWSFDDARGILESFVYNCIGDVEDVVLAIEKILGCMRKYLKYKHHFKFNYYFPMEIFDHGEGTCVDWTIFFIACLKILGLRAAFGTFKNNKGKYHAMALVKINDIGYSHYYYKDISEEMRGKWIIIDPQLPLNEQSSQWVEQWNLVEAYPL